MSKEMLTTKEVAEYLSINEKQVYRLVKQKTIPATRITGKWLFPKELIHEWVVANARKNIGSRPQDKPSGNQLVIAGSNDLALELLTKTANIRHPGYIVSISNVGSLAGFIALQNGSCHIAASHLLDLETGEYNSSFIKKHFSNLKVAVVNLAYREQGLMVREGNPLGIKTLRDLASKKTAFVNRQEGSGTRVLLEYKLREEGISPSEIPGYSKIAHTHMEVALEIFGGTADVGMGILASAKLLGLGFIPLATERFDLIIPSESLPAEPVRGLREVLDSAEFKSSVTRMGGYSTRDTAKIMYEMG